MDISLASVGIVLVKLVKFALGAYSLLVVAIVVERWLVVRWTDKQEQLGFRAVQDAFNARNPVRAIEEAGHWEAPGCIALASAAKAANRIPRYTMTAGEQAFVAEAHSLQRGLRAVASVASTAPYVGLFGTVVGILNAFQTIAATGQTGAAIVAGGITEALITTAMGLGVAVPSVIAYNWLSGKINDLTLVGERHARELIAYLLDSDAVDEEARV